MMFSSDPAVRPPFPRARRFSVRRSPLKDFQTILWQVAGVETSIAVASFLALYLWKLSPYWVLLDAPIVGLLAFCLGFSIARQTGKIGIGLRACLLVNLGYFIGLVIVGALAFLVGLFSLLDSYDGFLSTLGLAVALFFLALVMIGVESGALLVSAIGGFLGSLLGQWRAQGFRSAEMKDRPRTL